ncbi:hypothetical protein ILUMI_02903 [Ignelater luminosus]|uniref:DUF5641 domain-containing protein n=1 Tax=Ignelater luminosus TaxID=2038154 RepID=A0A8K0DHI9_IGNLU|nr:hypothetical protein ILUMI_02903 [Ignelater luminosus]
MVDEETQVVAHTSKECVKEVLLRIVPVTVKSQAKIKNIFALFDEASTVTLIAEDLANDREIIEGPRNVPALSRTKLGWVLHGNLHSCKNGQDDTIILHIKHKNESEELHEEKPKEDTLTLFLKFCQVKPAVLVGEKIPTKRDVLKVIMSALDPLELLGHFTIRGNLMLQEIWRSGIMWDEEVPDKIFEKWKSWLRYLDTLKGVEIGRSSKQSARSETKNFKTYVAHRVGEIQEHSDVKEWKWVPSKLNVADIVTRGEKSLDFFAKSVWFNGLSFLCFRRPLASASNKNKKDEDFSKKLEIKVQRVLFKVDEEVNCTLTTFQVGLFYDNGTNLKSAEKELRKNLQKLEEDKFKREFIDDKLPRNNWPLGRIVATFPDKNGIVRVVNVKTNCGTLRRPVSKLCRLDFLEDSNHL